MMDVMTVAVTTVSRLVGLAVGERQLFLQVDPELLVIELLFVVEAKEVTLVAFLAPGKVIEHRLLLSSMIEFLFA
jgi:hypothetical protein